MNSEAQTDLANTITKALKKANRGSKAWSFAYHLFAYGTVLLSLAAAILLQTEYPSDAGLRSNVASVLDLLASAAGAVAGLGGFQRKWWTNRRSLSRLDDLRLALHDPDAEYVWLRKKLAEIRGQHDEGIIGPEDNNP